MNHRYEYSHKIIPRLRSAYANGGLRRLLFAPFRWISRNLTEEYLLWFYTTLRHHRTFRFADSDLHYLYHRYNRTYRNERSVEVAIGHFISQQHQGQRILEVGNVLSHYFGNLGDVLDKFETGHGIINQDIADFHPSLPYDLIISISTLEHVGWDEELKDDTKIPKVWHQLTSWLAPGGLLVVSVPLGYNPTLDQYLQKQAFLWSNITYLQRYSADNQWQEIKPEASLTARYNSPYQGANVIAVIQYFNPS